MKCIVYPSPTGVWITTPAPRTAELRKAAEACAGFDRQLADVTAQLRAKPPAKSVAEEDDIKALEAQREALSAKCQAAEPPDDDAYIAAMAADLYPDGRYVIVDKADLPTIGDSATDWVIREGKVHMR